MTDRPAINRWLRVSLRSLLVVLTLLAVGLGWFANYAHKRTTAFAKIEEAGGEIQMAPTKPTLLEQWFGSEIFGSVYRIDLRQGKERVDNSLLEHLGNLTELQQLDLSYAHVDDAGVQHIAELPLTELWLQSTKITDASAATLSQMPTLVDLQLNSTDLSNQFLESLEPLPNLRELGMRGTKVTGEGMAFMPRHSKLERFDVYHTDVDDAGVARLTDCTALARLGLSMTNVTDEVFAELAKMPQLTDVDLSGNRPVTTEAVKAFEAAHPQCDIEWYRD